MQDQTSHNSLWFLMARSLSGEATALEEEQLHQVLQQDISLQQQYDLMKRMWHAVDSLQQTTNSNEEEKQSVNRILKLAKTETQPGEEIPVIQIRSKRKYLYAFSGGAAALILVAASWFYFSNSKKKVAIDNPHTQDLVAENGSRTRTILPDGSTVWLNAGSHISFNEDFSGKTREVTLDGEAYFDVVKQPERPFIVHVSGYNIKVLGTAFNVKSYTKDKTVETTLIRGLVQVTRQDKKEQQPIVLHPNQKLIVDKFAANVATNLPDNNNTMLTSQADPEDFKITKLNTSIQENERIETAWVYNRLQFRGDSFKDLADKLERWYNVKITFDDERIQQLNFTGSFEQETIEQVFAALKTANDFNYRIEGKEIHVYSVK